MPFSSEIVGTFRIVLPSASVLLLMVCAVFTAGGEDADLRRAAGSARRVVSRHGAAPSLVTDGLLDL